MSLMSLASARSPHWSHWSHWSQCARLARIILGCGLVTVLGASLAACSQTSSPPSNAPHLGHCAKVKPDHTLRFWTRDTLLVSLASVTTNPVDYPTEADQDSVKSLILHAINLQASDTNVAAAFADPGDPAKPVTVSVSSVRLFPFGATAVAIVQIKVTAPSSPTTPVDCVGAVVDTVNYAISNRMLRALDQSGNNAKWLTGASPDFYSLGAPADYTGGSPSGIPDAVADAQLASPVAGSQLGQTTVFVLDTYEATACPASATTCTALSKLLPSASAFDTVKDAGPDATQQPVICQPAKPGDCPTDTYNALATFLQHQGLKDHGRFVAAIIRRLAPNADLQMIRVLNDSGVGTVAGLIEALHDVYTTTNANSTVVINMSLTTVPPPGCLFELWQTTYASAQDGTQKLPSSCQAQDQTPLNTNPGKVAGDRAYQHGMLIPLGSVINQFVSSAHTHQYLLVAAAGNDSLGVHNAQGVPTHLGADLPAGYCGVTAVASAPTAVGAAWLYSPTATQLSDFSNAPTVAGQQCVTVGGLTAPANGPPAMPSVGLSGSGGSNTAVVARGEGVCSLFADSPARLGSDSGMAQWKGTSFATAFISGNAARSNQGWPPQTVLDDSSPCGA